MTVQPQAAASWAFTHDDAFSAVIGVTDVQGAGVAVTLVHKDDLTIDNRFNWHLPIDVMAIRLKDFEALCP